MGARIASAALGTWLAFSVYLWPHPGTRGLFDLMLGTVLALTGLCGIWIRALRYFDGLMGLLMLASFAAHNYSEPWMGVHDGLLGLALVVLAAFPGRDAMARDDHWVEQYDRNPLLLRRPFRSIGRA